MASAIQSPSVVRKLIYAGLILGLFVVINFSGSIARVLGGKTPDWTVSSQQKTLELSELDRGTKAELSGQAVRLTLTGSRGLAVSALWLLAIEKQKKHEWNDLELLVKTVTKIQPQFLMPWLFQSWNLSYNVSVESDRVKDKFFYITRGIELLAEGERVNKRNPDMRFWEGFYYMNKFGVSDEANYLRSLFQMSCIDPKERDPKRFRERDGSVNLKEFQDFCVKHPQLVRRLKDFLRLRRPEQVVEFLAENRNIPSRFDETPSPSGEVSKTTPLKPPADRFPILPIPGPGEWLTRNPDREFLADASAEALDDTFDNYLAARSWLAYAQDPLVPPSEEPAPTPKEYDRTKYRVPRSPMLIIFRQYPARAQSYVGERLLKEGWFDSEGWVVEDRSSSPDSGWFDQPLAFGSGRNWCQDTWDECYRMWREHGEKNGLYITPERLQQMQRKADVYRKRFNLQAGEGGPELRPDQLETPELQEGYKMHWQLHYYGQNRQVTNYAHFLYRSQAEKEPDTIQARKALFLAERSRGDQERALSNYQKGFELWKQRLLKSEEFRKDSSIQEDVYAAQMKYIDLLQDYRGQRLGEALGVQFGLESVTSLLATPVPVPPGVAFLQATFPNPTLLPGPSLGPLDGNAPDGQPWVPSDAVSQAQQRNAKPTPTPTAAPAPAK
jgi:hypothetical protein